MADKKLPPQVAALERRDMEGSLELDPDSLDPGMNYRWVSDSPVRIARHRMKGYVPVTHEDGVRTLIDLPHSADGIVRVADSILMKCPRAIYRSREKARLELTTNRLRTNDKEVREKARERGVRIITDQE